MTINQNAPRNGNHAPFARVRLLSGGVLVVTLVAVLVTNARTALGVGGISGSKLVAPCTETVPKGKLEFEPYLGLSHHWQGFDRSWAVGSAGGRFTSTELGFRFTVGLAKTLEVGLILPVLFERQTLDTGVRQSGSGVGDIPVGLKWRFLHRKKVALALQAGSTIPVGNHEPEVGSIATGAGYSTLDLGLILTTNPYQYLSIDVCAVGAVNVGKVGEDPRWGGGLNVAFGFPIGQFQPVVELGYGFASHGVDTEHILSMALGFTYTVHARAIIVTGVQTDFAGRSGDQTYQYVLAFTFLI